MIKNENPHINRVFIRRSGFRNILLLSVVIFAFFVAYKYISSGIDEQRQKSILKEKNKKDLMAQEQLDQCIAQTYKNLNRKYAEALSTGADAIRQGKVSQPTGSAWVQEQRRIADKEAEIEKEECYRRYK